MKLSSNFQVFLRKTVVQKSCYPNSISLHHMHGTTSVLVCEFPLLSLSTASSYEGGTISFQDNSDGVLTSK